MLRHRIHRMSREDYWWRISIVLVLLATMLGSAWVSGGDVVRPILWAFILGPAAVFGLPFLLSPKPAAEALERMIACQEKLVK